MKADIITIGDEILIGQTLDTNSAWIGNELESNGIHVNQITTVSDSSEHIISCLSESLKKVDFVFITGGLGPTKDDITKKTLCNFFDDELILSEDVLNHITHYFDKRSRVVNDYTRLQALVPSNCKIIPNHKGTAPGMWFDYKGKVVVSMPGVPHEMKNMMHSVIDELKERYNLLEIVHKTVYTRGIIESALAETISDWEEALPKEIKLAYLPSLSCLMLRFTARGNDKLYLENLIKESIQSLKPIICSYYSPIQKRLSEEVVAEVLLEKNATISTAESCTGGNIAKMLTSISGSSNYFVGSVVAYSNTIKEEVLNIRPEVIKTYGVVSEEVAREMALSSKKIFKSDYAIATTGLASTEDIDGVTGGTICYAIASPEGVFSQKVIFNTSRKENIQRASNKALNYLISLF
ncbi:MAG: CinA family nicotinamide mononucleotide deamidase-related protein [Flavobacteriales bacterium]|nr:CinA family nicotinamide mononucleotide deamidase-related protein [Flavobacteriales bacterium]